MRISRYAFHKWLAIPLGLVLVAWIVSGIIMTIPASPLDIVDTQPPRPDYSRLQVSPAEAAAAARDGLDDDAGIRQIALRPLLDGMVYEVRTSGGIRLIDAASGELMLVTPELARRIALASVREGLEISELRRLDRHEGLYRFGPIPVYEIRFVGQGSARAYVSAVTGEVRYGSLSRQLRAAISSLHDFFILTLVVENELVRRTLLWLASAATILLTASGYYLVLKSGLKLRRTKAGSTRAAPEGS